jgi:hypothetical protein
MAQSDYDSPSEVFGTGYSSDGTSITLTIGTGGLLPNLTAASANASTGDFRDVLYGLQNGLFLKFNEIPQLDRPTQMTSARSTSEVNSVIVRGFSSTFNMDGDSLTVIEEPAP